MALHAIGAFGEDSPREVVEELVSLLIKPDPRGRAAASAALKVINSENALAALIRTAKQSGVDQTWLLATIGQFPAGRVRAALSGDQLLEKVAPLLALGPEDNWLSRTSVANDLNFLLMQDL